MFSYRAHPPLAALAEEFTVYNYDRGGRGDSGDTPPYHVEREIEDIEALIDAAGGQAYVWGLSSGAVLALQAAARDPRITKLALQEPPFMVTPNDPLPAADATSQVWRFIEHDDRAGAVAYVMSHVMGLPAEVVDMMRSNSAVWQPLVDVANTLPYDFELLREYQTGQPIPADQWQSVEAPVQVMVGPDSPAYFASAAKNLVKVLPRATLATDSGFSHMQELAVDTVAAALKKYFAQ